MADWFTVNVRDAPWRTHDTFGSATRFEDPELPFPEFGINLRVLRPGQPNSLYHRESLQEDFLVLAGECLLLVEGEERRLGAWDFVHCPPETDHVFVGAGDGPCVILMAGSRDPNEVVVYPVSELAARYGASVETQTDVPKEAYAPYGRPSDGRPPDWDKLPWTVGY
jgi:uncharacterized cupin superfamily protein